MLKQQNLSFFANFLFSSCKATNNAILLQVVYTMCTSIANNSNADYQRIRYQKWKKKLAHCYMPSNYWAENGVYLFFTIYQATAPKGLKN